MSDELRELDRLQKRVTELENALKAISDFANNQYENRIPAPSCVEFLTIKQYANKALKGADHKMYHEKLTDKMTAGIITQTLIELNAIRNSFLDGYRSIENLIDEIQDEDNELTYAPDGILELLEDTVDPARMVAENMDEINTGLETILEKVRTK